MELDDNHMIPVSPSSLKTKLKNSLCFYCCFRGDHHHHHSHRQVLDSPPPLPLPADDKPALLWTKTRMAHDLKDDIKDKCMTIFGRGCGNGSRGGGGGKHKRHSSAEFRYDPLSYSLNFEDGFGAGDDEEYPLRNFSARLPPSPPVVKGLPTVREITAT
ncbi:hypothetical protein ACH5RR_005759 [Cinchona calisaya]|uniref:Uncharacterized protein n=1 Tax=Cinchona calisaya TaxID=153742 RepID=A0ABD3AM31_9GENT